MKRFTDSIISSLNLQQSSIQALKNYLNKHGFTISNDNFSAVTEENASIILQIFYLFKKSDNLDQELYVKVLQQAEQSQAMLKIFSILKPYFIPINSYASELLDNPHDIPTYEILADNQLLTADMALRVQRSLENANNPNFGFYLTQVLYVLRDKELINESLIPILREILDYSNKNKEKSEYFIRNFVLIISLLNKHNKLDMNLMKSLLSMPNKLKDIHNVLFLLDNTKWPNNELHHTLIISETVDINFIFLLGLIESDNIYDFIASSETIKYFHGLYTHYTSRCEQRRM